MLTDAERKRADWMLLIIGLLVVCGIIAAIIAGHRQLIDHAVTSYEADTMITAQSNWLPGESKDCRSLVLNARAAAALHREQGYALQAIVCDDGPLHSMKVTFYGKQVQPEYATVLWHCTRNRDPMTSETEFTCKQTGGIAPAN
jgi:hypothetical protein